MDDIDPLFNNSSTTADQANNTTNNKKAPLKSAQAFLGENSALVNLDNLIKPITPQNQVGSAAYNPFSDSNVTQPKPNLFQQQQPAVIAY